MLKVIGLILLGFFGVWLIYWDVVDFTTQGLNFGIWDWDIIVQGFPSIATGIVIVLVVTYLGIRVVK